MFILSIAVPSPVWHTFDYLPPPKMDPATLQVGGRIQVPFGRRTVVGVLIEIKKNSELLRDQLKQAIQIIDQQPLISKNQLRFYQWASDYYHYPVGEVIFSALPKWLRQGKSVTEHHILSDHSVHANTPLVLNPAQQSAVNQITEKIENPEFQVFLLSGITGSGKTEVYLHCIARVLANQKQALVLVPEIGLTPQTVNRFRQRFSVGIAVLHSHLSDKARAIAWQQAMTGEARIIIGTRSALFTPLPQLGLIILDEEHDLSFKQQSGFRYSARDCAVRYAQLFNIPVVLGSATPSLESLYNVLRNRYQLLSLPARVGKAVIPATHIIDIRRQSLTAGISEALFSKIDSHLAAGNQVLLFLNRRGFAPALICHQCGWIKHCQQCDARMTLHRNPKRLHCHHCSGSEAVPVVCPHCQQSELIDIGLGTQRLEAALSARYSDYPIMRIDRDSTRTKNSLQNKLQLIHDQKAQILIGTQLLAKGHHFPHLTLVAIVDADSGLLSTDFRALERLGQLFVQVAGRSGRESIPGEVVLQTHYPSHPLFNLLLEHNYDHFSKALLTERETLNLPPYSYMALLRAEATEQSLPQRFLINVKQYMGDALQTQGPIPACIARKAGRYRYQLLLQSKNRADLHHHLSQLILFLATIKNKKLRWSLDIDPQDMG